MKFQAIFAAGRFVDGRHERTRVLSQMINTMGQAIADGMHVYYHEREATIADYWVRTTAGSDITRIGILIIRPDPINDINPVIAEMLEDWTKELGQTDWTALGYGRAIRKAKQGSIGKETKQGSIV